MAQVDLICVGEPLFELSNVAPGQWRSGIGGDVSNVAVAAARQGVRSAMVSFLGDDPFGAEIREFWRAEGIHDDYVKTLPDRQTGLYLISHENGEHRFEYRRAGSAASQLGPEHLQVEVFQDVPIVHVSGISQAISATSCAATDKAIEMTKLGGGRVSYDPNLRLKLWPLEQARRVILATIEKVDILLPGLDDAQILTGLQSPEDIIHYFKGLGPSIVALTMGDQGVLLSFRDEVRHIPAPSVEAVDASGAGDCFDGTFLSQLINGSTVTEAAIYASSAAALSVQGHGAAQSIPRREAVVAALKRSGAST